MKTVRLAAPAVLALLFLAGPALAQYVWIDEKGVRQYSDMPPPTSVPMNRILKQPRGSQPLDKPAGEAPASADAAAATASAPKAPPTVAERNADFRKRQAEQAEKDKKEQLMAQNKAIEASNCERARNYLRTLESGERISQPDAGGERVYLSDEQREKEIQSAKRVVRECKS